MSQPDGTDAATSAGHQLRVLVGAYACDPTRGSEPGVGWQWVRGIARNHEAWVLTRAKNRAPIAAALAAEPELHIHPVYVDFPRVRAICKPLRAMRVYYLVWQLACRRRAAAIVRANDIDVAHHVTFAVDWLPTALDGVGVPLVWGPVGGSTYSPVRQWRWIGPRGVAFEVVRLVVTRLLRAAFARRTARGARLIVVQNPDGARSFSDSGAKVVVEPNSAVDADALLAGDALATRDDRGELVAVSATRLLPFKGLAIAIAALEHPGACRWRLEILGDGPDRRRLARIVRRRGLESRVTFRGKVPRREALATIADADAFVLPSLHEAAGLAVAEAITLGTPVVTLAYGGTQVLGAAGPVALIDPCGTSLDVQVAESLDSLPPRDPTRRWDSSRIPALVDGWYASVLEAADGAQSGD